MVTLSENGTENFMVVRGFARSRSSQVVKTTHAISKIRHLRQSVTNIRLFFPKNKRPPSGSLLFIHNIYTEGRIGEVGLSISYTLTY